MKFYNSIGPNPKLVRVFASEKGIAFPETVDIDIMGGENRQEPYLSKNPTGQMPCLELDDGRVISETTAICEYLDEQKAEPALVGATAADRAETRMWVRRIEWGITQPLADGFRYAEGMPLFKDRIRTIPQAADDLKAKAHDGWAWLDEQMAGRDWVVGDRFSLADVVLYAWADFAPSVGQPLDPEHKNIAAWLERVKARPSADA